ncbi:ScaI restriction endonuclease [Moraxella caprae]|uniref:ScaI restriction endonuclease n=1 Tax=Moraxella caprae TaxID=90240 RepID=A0A378QVX6_9GAMM|nr:ScaI family restriction endonuclease [Moraxella caprae]STZ07134.1 ScaI restriction endonuclease [Moraxella caprae]
MSPYANQPMSNWPNITQNLIDSYPLKQSEILEIAIIAWQQVWDTVIGNQISLQEFDLPATIVGYFFQKLFANELERKYPKQWRGELNKNDKDLVYIENSHFSTEMKTSGQMGYCLYGNRSYNQRVDRSLDTKDKSGFYITLNFYHKRMTCLRIGWIDQDDWIPQSSQTGQAATLKPEVYQYKMQVIGGSYIKETPVAMLKGVGSTTLSLLEENKIFTFYDLKSYNGDNKKIIKLRDNNYENLG